MSTKRCRARIARALLVFGGLISLAARSLAAAELPESPDAPSAFLTIIEAREYDDRFESVEDVLDHAAGVRVRRFGGLGAYSTASIRGSKAEQVVVLVDGVRLNSAYRGAVDLSSLSLRSIDRIEILRGAGGSRFGSDAVGGVISIRTRRAAGKRGADLALGQGTLDTFGGSVRAWHRGERGQLSLAYDQLQSRNDFRFEALPETARVARGAGNPATDPLAFLRDSLARSSQASRLQLDDELKRDNSDFRSGTLMLRGARRLGRDLELDGSLQLYQRDGGQPGLGNRSYTQAREEFRRVLGSLRLIESGLDRAGLQATLGFRHERASLEDPGGQLVFQELANPVDPNSRVGSTDWTASAELVHAWRPLELGPATLATRMSTALRYDQLRAGIDDFEDRNDAKHRWVASGWLQQDVRLLDGFVRLLPALGYEAADTSAGTTRVAGFSTPVEQDPRDEDVWLPRLGLIIQPRPGLRLKANALRSYRRPNFIELFHPDYTFTRGNPELRAEDAWNYDAGIELGIDRLGPLRDLRLEAAWFLREIDESIEWVRTASSGATVMPRNTGPARVRGSELSAALRLGARLELSASYTFVDSEIRATGRPLPHVPRNRLFARARLDLEAAWIWVEQIYEDKQSITPTGRNLADETWQLDAGLTLWPARFPGLHRLPERLSLSLEGTNLTEVQRFDGFGVPLPAQRLWMTRIRWSIGE